MFFRMVYKSGQIFLPFCHNTRVWQTNRQTDRILVTIPRLHYMQRGRKMETVTTSRVRLSFHAWPILIRRSRENEAFCA